MKYVWLVALLLLLGASWSMGSPEQIARLSDLADRQAEFARLITNQIQASRPGVTAVDFQQLYVESVRTDEILKAHFRYVIHEAMNGDGPKAESTDQTLEGVSLLTSEDGGLSWQVGKTKMTNSDITFNEGTLITPQPAGSAAGVPTNVAPAVAPAVSPSTRTESEPDLKQ
jgi:hypothetical protein